jgi:hypothetical protein
MKATTTGTGSWSVYAIKSGVHLEIYNGLDMMDSLSITVFEDRSILDGASTSVVVREHFKQWAATAPQQEQGTGPALSQRYRYCVQVDAVALESVIHDAPSPPQPDTISDGFMEGLGAVQTGSQRGGR